MNDKTQTKLIVIDTSSDSANIKKYKKVINKFLLIDDDNEQSHIAQDKIYRQFIKDIVKKSFVTQNETQQIASLINKYIIKNDTDRWYA